MQRHLLTLSLLAATALAGCATPLTSMQKAELEGYRAKGLAIEEKSPGTATALGILPGGGSFYTRNYGWGVTNLLLWPLSVFWDPISGRDGAERLNYELTVEHLAKQRDTELAALESKLLAKSITTEFYALEKARIERKYSAQQ